MFEADNIRDWRDHDVVDPDSDKIGELEAVYVDTASDQPAFASVKVGMVGRHRLTFVPLGGASVGPSRVRVAYPKKQVKDALTNRHRRRARSRRRAAALRALRPRLPARCQRRTPAGPTLETGSIMALFLLIIIAAIVLGITGVVVKGLIYLLIIGIVIFIVDFVFLGARLRGRRRGPSR